MGNFELGLTSYLFYTFITVVSTILLYRVCGRWGILFFLSFNIGGTNTDYYKLSRLIC